MALRDQEQRALQPGVGCVLGRLQEKKPCAILMLVLTLHIPQRGKLRPR